MLSKKNRISKKEIDFLFKKGKQVNSSVFGFRFYIINGSPGPRISFIVPKSLARLAVERNLLRRKGYFVLKKYINRFPVGIIGIFLFKKKEKNVSKIEDEIKNILIKIN